MYVVVNHDISNPAAFWSAAESLSTPKGLTLVHTFPAPDGRKAVCVWESASIDAVRTFLDPATAGMARNEYFQVLNKEGVAMPTLTRAAGSER